MFLYLVVSVVVGYSVWVYNQQCIPEQNQLISAIESIVIGLSWPIILVIGIFLSFS